MAEDKTEQQRVITPPFVGYFINAFVPRAGGNGKGKKGADDATKEKKYGVTAVWLDPENLPPEDKERWKAMLRLLSGASSAEFSKKWSELDPNFYRKGVRPNSSKEIPFDHPKITENAMFANLTSKYQPDVVDIRGNKIGPEYGNEGLLYQGCLMRASVHAYAFKGDEGKGVALGLNNLVVVSSNTKAWPRQDNRKSGAEDFGGIDDSAWLSDDDEEDARTSTSSNDEDY
jgi:hypothetical protein